LKKVLPIERAKMRIKMTFVSLEQHEKMRELLLVKYKNDLSVESEGDKLMNLKIEPNLYRELNNIIKDQKSFYYGVSIEINEQ
jgi:hypothetical protein